jgi:small subunit ribosomal protein S20
MANHASALKAHRQNVKRNDRNRRNRSILRTAVRRFNEQLRQGKGEEVKTSLPKLYSLVDKAVQKKVLSPNAAARHKSRLTRHLQESLQKAAPAQ